jgi:uncharacterized SAM-binding protein YcdF (DUF218 family)
VGELVPAWTEVRQGAALAPGVGLADAIIVLGATVLPGGVPSGSLRARAEGAAALYLRGAAPIVVTTGAHHRNPPGEAVVARDILLGLGVPADAIRIEEKSRNTLGNFNFARGLVPQAHRIYVVTEPFHMGRALRIARQEGFDPVPWPVVSPAWTRPMSRARLLLRDTVSLAFLRAGA